MTPDESYAALRAKLEAHITDPAALDEVTGLVNDFEATLEAYRNPSDAGPAEVQAFSQAAIALLPLSEEMRGRTLDSLSALLLPPTPTLLEQLAPTIQAALPAVLQAAVKPPTQPPSRAPVDDQHFVIDVRIPKGDRMFGVVVVDAEGKTWFETSDGRRAPISDEVADKIVEDLKKPA